MQKQRVQETLNYVRTNLKYRFTQASTLPCTCSLHHSSTIAAKRESTDVEYSIKYDLMMDAKDDNVDVSEIKVSEFSMFQNDEKLWLGVFFSLTKMNKIIKFRIDMSMKL